MSGLSRVFHCLDPRVGSHIGSMLFLLLFIYKVMSDSLETPWTVAHQAPLSMGFPKQEYRSALPFSLQGIFPIRDQTCVSCISSQILYDWTTREAHWIHTWIQSDITPDYFWKTIFFLIRICFNQFSSVTQACPTLCDPMNRSMPGLPVHHKLPEFTQTHAHRVGDAIQPSHPLLSPSPPAPNPSQHQSLFQRVNSSHEVAKVLEFQLQHQSFQWTPRTDLL